MALNEACAICLDVVESKQGVVLPCCHVFHGECILIACRGMVGSEWRCPLCRALVVRPSGAGGKHRSHRSLAVLPQSIDAANHTYDDGDTYVAHEVMKKGRMDIFAQDGCVCTGLQACKSGATKGSKTGRCDGLGMHGNMHYCYREETMWKSMRSFIICSLKSMEVEGVRGWPMQSGSMSGILAYGAEKENLVMECVENRCMGVVEICSPRLAGFITSLAGKHYIECILDPSKPSPRRLMIRYLLYVMMSLAGVVGGLVLIQWFMCWSSSWLCSIATWMFTSLTNGTYGRGGKGSVVISCTSQPPKGYYLPACFGLLGLYICVEAARFYDIRIRDLLYNWEKYAWKATMLWIVLSMVYTLFVFMIRLVITFGGLVTAAHSCVDVLGLVQLCA